MQLPLFDQPVEEFPSTNAASNGLVRHSFSHGDICPQTARIELEQRFAHLLHETHRFDRQTVSFQGNKRAMLHSWIKYREGFSAQLVETLIQEFNIQPG